MSYNFFTPEESENLVASWIFHYILHVKGGSSFYNDMCVVCYRLVCLKLCV